MIFVLLICLLRINLALNHQPNSDYCAHEYFNPECNTNEVIVMENATYGRMEIGRCLKMDMDEIAKMNPKYFGCSADVLDLLDVKCSGLKTCNLRVNDPQLLSRSTCYQDLVLYLQAHYSCLPVTSADRGCAVSVSESAINLSFKSKELKFSSNCGRETNPFVIETSPGQTLAFSMIEFGRPDKSDKNVFPGNCDVRSSLKTNRSIVGNIKETGNVQKTTQFCKSGTRNHAFYNSLSTKVELILKEFGNLDFLLVIRATGCYDLKPPQDAWMKRDGNEITVGCYMNRHIWKLTCNGRNWVGVIGNCTQQSQGEFLEVVEVTSLVPSKSDDPKMIFLLTVAICCVFLVCLLVLCIFLVIYQSSLKSKPLKTPFPQFKSEASYSCNGLKMNSNISCENNTQNYTQANMENEKDRSYFLLDEEDESKRYFVLEPKADEK